MHQKARNFYRCLVVALSPTILTLSGWSAPQERLSSPTAGQISVNFPQSSSDRSAPARSVGAGSRGSSCDETLELQAGDVPLTALTPQNNILKTISPNPSIYLYVPPAQGREAIFQVINKQTENIVYSTTLTLDHSTAGILALNLPEEIRLKPNVTYHWGFFIICNPDNELQDEGVEGWIEVEPLSTEMERQLKQVEQDPIAQAQLYAQAGAWNETMALVAELRDSNPQEWLELLRSVNLPEAAAKSPVIEAPTVNRQLP